MSALGPEVTVVAWAGLPYGRRNVAIPLAVGGESGDGEGVMGQGRWQGFERAYGEKERAGVRHWSDSPAWARM